MFQFATHSARLLFQGRLFRDPGFVLRQGLLGTALVVVLFLVLGAIGLGLVTQVVLASFLGGTAIPYLFRDLKAQ